jgi:hypothetical protein
MEKARHTLYRHMKKLLLIATVLTCVPAYAQLKGTTKSEYTFIAETVKDLKQVDTLLREGDTEAIKQLHLQGRIAVLPKGSIIYLDNSIGWENFSGIIKIRVKGYPDVVFAHFADLDLPKSDNDASTPAPVPAKEIWIVNGAPIGLDEDNGNRIHSIIHTPEDKVAEKSEQSRWIQEWSTYTKQNTIDTKKIFLSPSKLIIDIISTYDGRGKISFNIRGKPKEYIYYSDSLFIEQ